MLSIWQQQEVAEDSCFHWRIGPLDLWIERRRGDWLQAWQRLSDPLEPGFELDVHPPDPESVAIEKARFGSGNTDGGVLLKPVLPDRPVIVRPQLPLSILAGDSMRIFASLPLWICPQLAPSGRKLQSLPVFPPSDTWFGPDTLEGELAYASLSTARSSIEELVRLPHRAICSMRITNESAVVLPVKRLRIPVSLLALHMAQDGSLLTQDLEVLLEKDGSTTETRTVQTMGGGMPLDGYLVAEPRDQQRERSVLGRVVQTILG